jgi:pyruvate formate lyase activating enzyme
MKGIVFNIQRFCTDDVPGIRTTVFLKGCNMRCFWCHNPESLAVKPQIEFFADLCVQCGSCSSVCPVHAHDFNGRKTTFQRDICTGYGKCAENCAAEVLALSGAEMDTAEAMAQIDRDAQFYEKSGGGATFSGGEPLLQKDFLAELLVLCVKKGYRTSVESALNVPWKSIEEVYGNVDLFLCDIKLIDECRHNAATGCSKERILQNIAHLARSGKEIIVRIPIIPPVNGNIPDQTAIADFVKDKGIRAVEFMPYHAMAQGKYASLGLAYKGT